MPYQKNKSENYQNLQGLNLKVSRYIVGETEFLKLQNLDAKSPGALSSMPGTTQDCLGPILNPITGIADFYLSSPTFGYGSATYNLVATSNFLAYNFTGQTFSSFYTFLFPNNHNQFDFSKNDELYAANQYDFFRYPAFAATTGITSIAGFTSAIITYSADFTKASQYSLPKPILPTQVFGGSGYAAGITGNVQLAAAFVRTDGFVGPATFATFVAFGQSFIDFGVPTLSVFNNLGLGFSNYGIIGTRIWLGYDYNPYPKGYAVLYPPGPSYPILGPFAGMVLTTGLTNVRVVSNGASLLGAFNGATAYTVNSASPLDNPEDYLGTFLYGPEGDSGGTYAITIQPTNPACLEVFNNFLFMGGFLLRPDTIEYSKVGEFEKRDPENNFDFNANDGDIVSCLVAYFTQLIIFKINSVGALSGASADTFQLVTVSNQYGCLSSNGACVFQQRMWFLDKKGICEYNGANTTIVSNKLEPYFRRMNVNAARTVASMIHVKEQNQVQCSIPVDGATTCNLMVFYDYLADFWGTRDLSDITFLSVTDQGANIPVVRQGSLLGMVYSYGQSLTTYNGTAFTLVAQSRFITGDGLHTDEKMFRRLYIDADIPNGSTYNFLVNFYSDQGSSPALSATMTLGQFQNRMDFGIPATDLSVEIIYSEGNFLKLNGFTVEYRFQRQTSGQKV